MLTSDVTVGSGPNPWSRSPCRRAVLARPPSPRGKAGRPWNLTLFLLGIAVGGWWACDGGNVGLEPGVPPAVAVRVLPEGASVSGVGETTTFRVEALDRDGREIPSPTVTWSSRNPEVATADDRGVAMALMSGQATITAEADGVVGSAVLTVTVPGVAPVTAWATRWRGSTLEGIWGASPDDVFAVGEGGAILHYDGADWREMDSGVTEFLFDVWGVAPDDVFAVGYDGTILHYDGTSWGTMAAGARSGLKAVWGASSTEIFGVGYDGTILRFDGTTWSAMASGTAMTLYCVWGTSRSDVFAVGLRGTILHFDGEEWRSMAGGTVAHLQAAWGTSATDVFAVGTEGTILHFDGNGWTAMTSGTESHLAAVWGTSSADVYAAGEGGTVLHYDGSGWGAMTTPTLTELRGVWGTSLGDVYVVGLDGVILQGARWGLANDVVGLASSDETKAARAMNTRRAASLLRHRPSQ